MGAVKVVKDPKTKHDNSCTTCTGNKKLERSSQLTTDRNESVADINYLQHCSLHVLGEKVKKTKTQ